LRWTFIAWAPQSRRSEVFARTFSGNLYCVHYLKFRAPLYAPTKYVLQALSTLQILFKERAQVVHVQNPPLFCGLTAYLYCLVSRAQFVFDHHSAVFLPTWDWALPIHKFLSRRATTNIVTNQHWADIVRSWGGHALIMGDPFLDLPPGEKYRVKSGFNIAVVNTFAFDEPTEVVLAAASDLPDVNFYITGNTKRKPASFFENIPPNVTFTGFLPDVQYLGLLRAVDAVVVLTTRNYTLQLGACEAVSAQKPILISDWPFLREFFSRGTVYVSNDGDGVRRGVEKMRDQYDTLAQEVKTLRRELQDKWQAQLAELEALVQRRHN
jgi:glycosyltransferase involved in cell wall biosynthesis